MGTFSQTPRRPTVPSASGSSKAASAPVYSKISATRSPVKSKNIAAPSPKAKGTDTVLHNLLEIIMTLLISSPAYVDT